MPFKQSDCGEGRSSLVFFDLRMLQVQDNVYAAGNTLKSCCLLVDLFFFRQLGTFEMELLFFSQAENKGFGFFLEKLVEDANSRSGANKQHSENQLRNKLYTFKVYTSVTSLLRSHRMYF